MTPEEIEANRLIELHIKSLIVNSTDHFNYASVSVNQALITVNEILRVSLSYAGKDYDFYTKVKQILEDKLKTKVFYSKTKH